MRIQLKSALLAMGLSAALAQAASSGGVQFKRLSAFQAEQASSLYADQSIGNAWMWSNDLVYMPGQTLTAWWTVRPSADLIPVTIVAYRVNNQTGVKSYLPNGGEQATDIFGNAEGSFQITAVAPREKAPLVGNGGRFPELTLPNELGMHTIVVEFRDWTGNSVLKRLYQKVSVVDEIVNVSAPITADTTWVNTKSYLLQAVIFVQNATLTIEPGTIIRGAPGSFPAASLIVRNDSQLMAVGKRSQPIIFTSSFPPGSREPGDWGGVALLGRAAVNTFPDFIEGLDEGPDTAFGANPPEPESSCGNLQYVRVEFAGAQLDQDNELNALTFGACGSGTTAKYLQAHYGFDDSFEWFGGNNDVKYMVATAGSDDGFDLQLGYTGRAQFYVVKWYDDAFGDHGIEADNRNRQNDAEPVSNPQAWNFTIVGNGQCDDGCDGARLRRGLRGTFANMSISNFFDNTLQSTEELTFANIASGALRVRNLNVWDNEAELRLDGSGGANNFDGQFTRDEWRPALMDPANNVLIANPQFRSLEDSDWDLRPLPGSPLTRPQAALPPGDGFFHNDSRANCIGAFCGEDDWTEEWTTKLRESDIAQ